MVNAARLAKIIAVGSATLFTVPVAAQTFMTYTDRASYQAAISNPTIQTFDSYTKDTPLATGTPVTLGDLTISRSGPGNTTIDAPPTGTTNVNSTSDILVVSNNGTSNNFSFSTPVKAFGADFIGFNDVTQRSTFLVDGTTITPPNATSNSAKSFFGFVSSGTFSNVSIVETTGDTYALDNLTYASAVVAGAPEPATWSLMILGFGIAGGALRRQRRAADTGSVAVAVAVAGA